MKSITNFALSLSILVANTSAFATQDRWTEGFAQGNLEHFIDKGNTRLYIGCPTQEGSAEAKSSVSLLENDQEINAY